MKRKRTTATGLLTSKPDPMRRGSNWMDSRAGCLNRAAPFARAERWVEKTAEEPRRRLRIFRREVLAKVEIGENALHFCWCFFGHTRGDCRRAPCQKCRDRCHRNGASAVRRPRHLTTPPGMPAERAAGRCRFDLVLRLLQHKNIVRPSNGCVARLILVWALRLHDIPLQHLILQHETQDTASVNRDLSPMWKTTWLYKGEETNLVDAACAGWVTGTGTNRGWDVPFENLAGMLQWLRICHCPSAILSRRRRYAE